MDKAKKRNQRWTFQPDEDVAALLAKETEKYRDESERKIGTRTRLINQALRLACGQPESED